MIATSPFRPAPWLRGPHAQTLWASTFRRRPAVPLRRERLELPDGDFLDLDWTAGSGGGPLVLVLHGLEGSSRSRYAAGLLGALDRAGMRGVLMHFRGCSGEPNRLDRGYHSGETGDVAQVAALLRRRHPGVPLGVVGYSLGGNVLLKWLGEAGRGGALPAAGSQASAESPAAAGSRPAAVLPDAAVAVSVPFDLHRSAARLERGLSRLYQAHLLERLRRRLGHKFAGRPVPVDWGDLARLTTFRLFDDRVTAPLHGYAGVDDYYTRASCRQYLGGIAVPTLILHARDDPFMDPAAVPTAAELSPAVTLELSAAGGHVGFVGFRLRPRPRHVYWLEERIPGYLARVLEGG